jgi:transcriptional regulator with XRE-family HTH domain
MMTTDTPTTICDRIRTARNDKNLTRKALAVLCKVSAPTVTDWGSGAIKEISARNVRALALALGVTQEWLMAGETMAQPNDDLKTIINACPPRRKESLIDDIRYLITANDDRYELMREALHVLALTRAPKEKTNEVLKQLL